MPIPTTIETNHMLLALQLYYQIPFAVGSSGLCLLTDQWMPRAAKDARELILARRTLIKIAESDRPDEDKRQEVRSRIVNITHPYGIFLGISPPQCIFLKLPNGQSNEPTGKFWSVPR